MKNLLSIIFILSTGIGQAVLFLFILAFFLPNCCIPFIMWLILILVVIAVVSLILGTLGLFK